MKKNVMMRLAAILLVCVLASTCGISGTFAKYVTSDNGSDSARVARWGVTIDATVNMFADAYEDAETSWVSVDTDDTVTVRANTQGQNLVAPGTYGTMANFNISGVPEVDVEVTYNCVLTLTNWFLDANYNGTQDVGETDYFPLIITVTTTAGDKEFAIGQDGIETVAALQNAINTYINSYSNVYQTLDDLSNVNNDLVISWRWDFEVDSVQDHPTLGYQTNERDTILGNMVAFTTSAPIIDVALTCTITQVD